MTFSRPALTWCLDSLELTAHICVCPTIAEIVQAEYILQVRQTIKSLLACDWLFISFKSFWVDRRLITLEQQRRRRLTRSTKRRSSSRFSPSLPGAIKIEIKANSFFSCPRSSIPTYLTEGLTEWRLIINLSYRRRHARASGQITTQGGWRLYGIR